MKNLAICAGAFAFPCACAFAQPMLARIDFQDAVPKYIRGADGRFSGLCVDLMALIEKNSNIKFSHRNDFVPPKRIIERLRNGETDLHCGFAKTPDREASLNYAEPIYNVSYELIARADDPVVVSSIADIKKLGKDGLVLGVFGTSSNEKLRSLGLTVEDGGKDIVANFNKLLDGRGRFFVYHDLGITYEMNQQPFKGKFRAIPVDIESYQHWMVFSNLAPEGLVKETVRVIEKLKASGEWGNVTSMYLKN